MCDMLAGREPTGGAIPLDIPSPFGGAGGLSGERPPLDASDEELDAYAEWWFRRSVAQFASILAGAPRPRKKRRMYDYTAKNCEEASGGRLSS